MYFSNFLLLPNTLLNCTFTNLQDIELIVIDRFLGTINDIYIG